MSTTTADLPGAALTGIELWIDLYGPITPAEMAAINEYDQRTLAIGDTLDHAVYGSPADEYRRIAAEDGPGRARERLVDDLKLCAEWSAHLCDLLSALGDCGHQVSRAALEYRRDEYRRLDRIHEAIRTDALEWLLAVTAALDS